MTRQLMTLACLVATGTLLGLSTILARLAIGQGLAPVPFLAWATLGTALVLGAVAIARSQRPRLSRRSLEYAFVAALLSFVGPNLLLYAAVPHVGVAFLALMLTLPPLLTYAGALALGLEPFSRIRAVGVTLALAGAGWLAVLKLGQTDGPAGWLAAALCIPVLLSLGNLYRTIRWPQGARPAELAAPMLAAAAVLIFVGAPLSGQTLSLPLETVFAVVLVVVQIACFAGQMSLFFVLQNRGGPVSVSLLGSVAAVTAVPVAVILLGEPVPEGLAIGALLIVTGVAAVTFGGGRRISSDPESLRPPN